MKGYIQPIKNVGNISLNFLSLNEDALIHLLPYGKITLTDSTNNII